MSIIRVEKNRNYTVINNEFLRNKELSLKAKGLLAVCLSLPDTWNWSIAGLVAICKESITSVRSSLKELEEYGYVTILKTKDDKGRFIYEYTIYETPVDNPVSVSPDIQNLHLDNLTVEKQDIENVRQLNTNQLITEKENTNELNLYIKEHAYAATWSLFNDYLEMRKEIGAPLTMRGLKMLLTRVEKLSDNNINVQRLMLENAIQNQWKNVYRPKDQEIEAAGKALKNELKSFYGI
jgi:hypothetical protein